MLKAWRMIHPTFPNKSIEMYINKLCANDSHVLITTKEKLNQKDQKCTDLRNKILKDHHDIFKDQLGPKDRVNIARAPRGGPHQEHQSSQGHDRHEKSFNPSADALF